MLLLQAFQVAFLWLPNWAPLGRLNDVDAVRRADSRRRLIVVTVMQSLPYPLGLIFSAHHLSQTWPQWLRNCLWISYGLLFVGQMRAWWLLTCFGLSRTARHATN